MKDQRPRRWHLTLARLWGHRALGRLVPLALIVPGVAEVWARAGGGGRFSGGGGGGGGGGAGVAIYLVFQLIRLWIVFVMHHPIVGIPVTLAAVVIAVLVLRKGSRGVRQYREVSTIQRGQRSQDQHGRAQALALLSQRDPGFDETAFSSRVQQAFGRVQEAWSTQNLKPVQALLSDAVYERFSLQIRDQRQRGIRNEMTDVQVQGVDLVQASSDDQFDCLTVAVHASATDRDVALDTGKVIPGTARPGSFTEYWTFLRRPGAASLSSGGLMEGNCPNCAAPVELNETGTCSACSALIRSGEYDWVLSEITQASEWRVKEAAVIPGLADLCSRDPGVSVAHLEDRASVAFWRLIAAWQTGKAAAVRKVASDAFCESLTSLIAADKDGKRRIPTDPAVGGVELLAIVNDEPVDCMLAEVRWSSGLADVTADGTRRATSGAAVRTEVFVFERAHEAASSPDHVLSSNHCPQCGGPASTSASNACDYCGCVLNDGTHDWVLTRRLPRYDAEVNDLLAAARQADSAVDSDGAAMPGAVPHGSLELAAWLMHAMLADNELSQEEQEILTQFCRRHGITDTQRERLWQAVLSGELQAPEPSSDEETHQWLRALAEMALADGRIHASERKMLTQLGNRLGYSAADINQLIGRTRRELYQTAKQRLREQRRS